MVDEFFRKDLKDFQTYKVEEKNYRVVLDANESFLNIPKELLSELSQVIKNINFNRYPDATSKEVCEEYLKFIGSEYLGTEGLTPNFLGLGLENIIAGNGSDELIQIIISTFTEKGDKVVVPTPNFSMYKVYAEIAGAKVLEFPSGDDFKLNVNTLIEFVNSEKVKLLFISNPNNPTGAVIPLFELIKLLENTNAIVVIDEAYGEFYGKTMVDKIGKHLNLIVLKTCSKIGLAAIRLGFLITNEVLMNEIKKVKPPYNVNSVTQAIGTFMLRHGDAIDGSISKIVKEREYLYGELSNIEKIKAYPSNSNFILIQVEDGQELYKSLLEYNVGVRGFKDERLKNCLRVTVGSRAENFWFISHIKKIFEK